MKEELKDSGIVMGLSIVGFIFGLIGLTYSIFPCIGIFTLYLSLPAIGFSVIALIIAVAINAKRTFAITALTVSVIAASIAAYQWYYISMLDKYR